MEEPRTSQIEGAKHGAERAVLIAVDRVRRPAVWTGRAGSEKRVNLALQQPVLEGFEELFGFSEGQAQMLDACVVLFQGDEVGDGGFMAIIITHNELQFDAYGSAFPSSGGGGMM